jgi:hypothetical protein
VSAITRRLKTWFTDFRPAGTGGPVQAQHKLHARPTRDDVLHAFRLILGREPENDSAIDSHLEISTVSALRLALLNSEEFRGKFRSMHPDVAEHPYVNSERRTVIFCHLQKTGGTSLREIIGRQFTQDRRCPIFENKLHVLSLAELSHYDFFSGHFDFYSIRLIPRNNVETVCLFREPRARLISLYRFLRSHPSSDEFANDRLVGLAHAFSPEEFFEHPEIRLYSAFNNHYLFALGRSFLWFDRNRGFLSKESIAPILFDAKQQIHALAALGITERFDESVKLICHSLDATPPTDIQKLHVTDDFIKSDARFRRVESVQLSDRLIEATRDLIAYDSSLYEFATDEFESRLAIAAADSDR